MLQTSLSSLRTALAFLKRDFLIAASYRTAFAADALGIVFKVITFYYIGAVFGEGVAPSLKAYGHDYFAFLIIGIALLDFVHTSLDTFSVSIRDSQMTGTLEVVLLSPIQLPHMVVYSSLWPYVFTALKVACVLAMIGAIVGEYFGGSQQQLGIQIKNSAALFQFETAWAAILVACILGIAFYLAVSLAEIATLRRYPSAERAQKQGTS